MALAYCEPGNVDVNPPLALARDVAIGLFGSLTVEEGMAYGLESVDQMRDDFQKDILTPQKLKPAVTTAMAQILDAINAHIKSTPAAKKADAALKTFVKNLNKKKK